MEASSSNPANEQGQVATKRKMESIQCEYCEYKLHSKRMRANHMIIHECSKCHEIVLTDDVRAIHDARHQQEGQLNKLQRQRQRKIDEDFALYVKANRLNEIRSKLDYEPDFNYIVSKYQFQMEEWLEIVKIFKFKILNFFYGSFEDHAKRRQHECWIQQLNAKVIAYLLKNEVLSVPNAIAFLDILMNKVEYNDYEAVIVSYLLDNGCNIKVEWAAKVINHDEIIERIKVKHSFTFNQIHKARKWDLFSPFDFNALKMFYVQIQKHFFNSALERPFCDINVAESVRNHQQSRYIYDNENDNLTMFVGSGKLQCSIGKSAGFLNKCLQD